MVLSRWSTCGGGLLTSIVAATAATLVSAAPPTAPPSRIPHERRDALQEASWAKLARAPSSDVFEMRVGLAQRNLDRGHELLMDVADPRSANYGKHWTAEEVSRMFAPDPETAGVVVKEWLANADYSDIAGDRVKLAASGGWLVFNATVGEAERLLGTEFWLYEESESGVVAAGCDE